MAGDKRAEHAFNPPIRICIKCGIAIEVYEAAGQPPCSDRFPYVNNQLGEKAKSAPERGDRNRMRVREEQIMANGVYKVIELVGTSDQSISKAIEGAIAKAGHTVRHLGWFEVTQIRGRIENNQVESYQVELKAGFRLED